MATLIRLPFDTFHESRKGNKFGSRDFLIANAGVGFAAF